MVTPEEIERRKKLIERGERGLIIGKFSTLNICKKAGITAAGASDRRSRFLRGLISEEEVFITRQDPSANGVYKGTLSTEYIVAVTGLSVQGACSRRWRFVHNKITEEELYAPVSPNDGTRDRRYKAVVEVKEPAGGGNEEWRAMGTKPRNLHLLQGKRGTLEQEES